MFSSLELPRTYVLRCEAIFTMDPRRPRVEALAVAGGRIVGAGGAAEAAAALPAGAPEINVGRRMVLPGFTDSHIHYGYLVRKWNAVDLDGCASLQEALGRVRDFLARRPANDVPWIDGHGWDASGWERRPTAAALDAVAADRPAALTGKDGHRLWVNSAALAAAGIGRETPDPPGGVIERDPATGEPTGVLYEAAMKLVQDVLPEMSADALAEAMDAQWHRLHAQGITAIHCPELVLDWRAYQTLWAEGRLGVRVTFLPRAALLDQLEELGMASGFGDRWLRLGHLKLFADGTLGSRTAAMLAPFDGEPGNTGVVVLGGDELKGLVRRAVAGGLSVAVHAIGDRGVREALDAIEAATRSPGASAPAAAGAPGLGAEAARLPHRIEHAQLVDPADTARFARLNVVASMQPAHGAVDRANALKYWGARVAYASPYRSLLDAGAVLAFGSDAPFGLDLTDASFSVRAGVYAAVSRLWPGLDEDDRAARDAYAPGQVTTLEEALAAYTVGPAVAGGEAGWRGSLREGACADLVVLEENLFDVPVREIPHVPVAATVIEGRLVYRGG